MPKFRVPYSPEFRRHMVELVRSGRTPADLSRGSEPTAQSIWNWVRRAERDGGVTDLEPEERATLRREIHRLLQERDILAEAAVVGRVRPSARERTSTGSSSS